MIERAKQPGSLLILLFLFLSFSTRAQLKADFTSDTTAGCTPLLVTFTDISTGNPTSWQWDLGEGTIALNEPQASKVYTTPGTYTVTLTVSNASGTDAVTKQAYIKVYGKPEVDFSAFPSEGCGPLPVQFTDLTDPGSGTITQRVWDFGDGQISTEANPAHTYDFASYFGVLLTVENSFGCRTIFKKDSVVNVYDEVTAKFSYTYQNACQPPTQVSFTNSSTSKGSMTYQWDFGDGKTSTEANPKYTYTQPGNFVVKLTATSSNGCSNTAFQTISIGTVKLDFALPAGNCINVPLTFVNTSSPLPVSVQWDFGDGGTSTDLDGVHSFTKPGTYNVKLMADFGSCKSEIIHPVTILSKPVSNFQLAAPLSGCGVPATVQFKNASSAATSYQWLFGDGTTSTDPNPSHTYTKAGTYTVTLISFNTNQCTDTLVQTDFIRLGPPKITQINELPAKGCAPVTIKPVAVIQSPEPISSYFWDFGDGTTSTSATPTHTYTQPGTYQVTLIVKTTSGCTDTFVLANAVRAGVLPTAKFSADPLSGCAQTGIKFTDESTGNITSWVWNFGDKTVSYDNHPTHFFQDTGHFNISLVVSNNGCEDSVMALRYIHILPPKAKFSAVAQCDSKLTVDFADSSLGAQTWKWDFGDGQSSTSKNVSHTYAASGTYPVSLTVTNGACTDVLLDTITVSDKLPTMTIIQPQGPNFCRLDSIIYKISGHNTSLNTDFHWFFADNAARFQMNDSTVWHKYNRTGTFKPYVAMIYPSGCIDTVRAPYDFVVSGPRAGFTNPEGVCLNQSIEFTDQSTTDGTNKIVRYVWDFGDNTTQTYPAGPFDHLYTNTGAFNVKLVVYDNNGCKDSITKPNAVRIAKPIADFSMVDSIRCVASPMSFVNKSQGINLQSIWNFGDGSSSSQPAPQHAYSQLGTYSVKLNITDQFGCKDSIVKTNTASILNPKAELILNDTFGVCPPLLIQPVNNSINYTSVIWDFGDNSFTDVFQPQHYYNMAGNYNGSLVVQGHGNCFDTVPFSIVLKGPSGDLSYTPLEGCNPTEVAFSASSKNTVKHIWDFDNGVTAQTSNLNINYNYKDYGKYLPKLILVDAAGCQVTLINTSDTVVIAGVVPAMKLSQQTGCDSSLLTLEDSSLAYYDTINAYHWDFGDNTISSDRNPFHYYRDSGTYNVSLQVTTNKGCTESITLPVQVGVHKSPVLTVSAADSSCIFAPVSFSVKNTLADNALNWQWNFGDGNVNTVQNVVNTYKTAGPFTASVIGTDKNGCSDTLTHPVQILPLPQVSAGLDTVLCLGNPVNLVASGAVSYTWQPDPTLSCTDCERPLAVPDSSIHYYVTGKNSFGCEAKDSVFVEVKQPIHLSVSRLDSLCAGASLQLSASGAETYNWQPATGLSNPAIANPVATPSVTTTYTLVGSDSKNCYTDSAAITIQVFPVPGFNIIDSVIFLNLGAIDTLQTTSSPDVTRWVWNPATWLNCNDCPHPVVQPKGEITYTASAYNEGGCTTSDQVTIRMLCNGANIFVPNTFSPNNDGMNDQFFARGNGEFFIRSMKVFNRIGQMVFEKNNIMANNPSDGWDGSFKGQPLSSDVYVYVMEFLCDKNNVYTMKGNVSLIR